jgi:hypothetical protein
VNDRWLPALIVVALTGSMVYAISADVPSQHSFPITLGDLPTLAVAVATFFLVWVTRGSVRVAERSLTELERPWIIVHGAKITWLDSHEIQNHGFATVPASNRALNDWMITLHLKNVGRMPALIEEIKFKIEDTDTLPDTPDYSNPGYLRSPRTVAVGEECDTGSVGPAPGRPNQLTVYGLITYTGLGGAEHHTGFALNVAPYMPAFVRCEKAAYDHYD